MMIFFPSIGYFLQAYKFKKNKSSKGFSKLLCLILLIANILRIFFWFGKKFNKTLLYQSCVVIISQLFLIHSYLLYREDKSLKKDLEEMPIDIKQSEDKSTNGISIKSILFNWKETLNPFKFWSWENEIEYYKFTVLLVIIFGIICSYMGYDNKNFVNFIGTMAISLETVIVLPQIKENYRTKDTRNLSSAMVLMWLGGDMFKTMYNIIYRSPFQMIFGGFVQVSFDIILNTQVILYGENNILKKKLLSKMGKFNTDKSIKPIEEGKKLIIEDEEKNINTNNNSVSGNTSEDNLEKNNEN